MEKRKKSVVCIFFLFYLLYMELIIFFSFITFLSFWQILVLKNVGLVVSTPIAGVSQIHDTIDWTKKNLG